MLNLGSNYNCSNASADLPNLLNELNELEQTLSGEHTEEQQQELNRIRNQIHFIRNKCDIPHES